MPLNTFAITIAASACRQTRSTGSSPCIRLPIERESGIIVPQYARNCTGEIGRDRVAVYLSRQRWPGTWPRQPAAVLDCVIQWPHERPLGKFGCQSSRRNSGHPGPVCPRRRTAQDGAAEKAGARDGQRPAILLSPRLPGSLRPPRDRRAGRRQAADDSRRGDRGRRHVERLRQKPRRRACERRARLFEGAVVQSAVYARKVSGRPARFDVGQAAIQRRAVGNGPSARYLARGRAGRPAGQTAASLLAN